MELTRELILLCEGSDDQLFFFAQTSRPRMPAFDIPFPTERLHGSGAFGGMLAAIQGSGDAFNNVRGILIVADSKDDPSATFGSIRRQVQAAGGYPLPKHLGELAAGNRDFPAIQIALLPADDRRGCLETLYVEELERTHSGTKTCVEQFLGCGPITARNWPSEKADKARFHSLVAALNQDDPGKAASKLFKGKPPLISPSASIFDPIVKLLRGFDAAAKRS